VGEFARSYPSTAPTVLARPVLEHFRDVTRLLNSPLPVARRQRLAVVAGHLAGLAGSLAFDLRDEGKALAYFKVAVQAADDADSPDLAAWALATRSLIPTYTGDPAAALALLQEAQDRARSHVSHSRLAWLAALEVRAHAGLGDAAASRAALGQADRAIERAEPEGGRFATDFFDRPRLAGFRGTSHLLLGQPKAAQAALADVLTLRDPATSRDAPWPASTWPRLMSRTTRSRRRVRLSPAPWPSARRTASGRSCAAPARSAPHWSHGATNNWSRSWTSSCARCCPPDSPGLGRPPVA
jgi:tetratricopeptide (TPR) repeat protein